MTGEVATDRYSLPLPDGWTDRTAVTITGPERQGVTANVVVTRQGLCRNMALGGFADGWLRQLHDEVPVEEVGPVEHTRIDGRRAQVRTVSWRAAGLDIQQIVGLVVDAGEGYAVVGTASREAFPALEEAFREAIAGFRFARPADADDGPDDDDAE